MSLISIFFIIFCLNENVKSMAMQDTTKPILDLATYQKDLNQGKKVIYLTFDDGHSIGLHTYTHKFKRIYSNGDAFIKEMVQCREKVNGVVGISPNYRRYSRTLFSTNKKDI